MALLYFRSEMNLVRISATRIILVLSFCYVIRKFGLRKSFLKLVISLISYNFILKSSRLFKSLQIERSLLSLY